MVINMEKEEVRIINNFKITNKRNEKHKIIPSKSFDNISRNEIINSGKIVKSEEKIKK